MRGRAVSSVFLGLGLFSTASLPPPPSLRRLLPRPSEDLSRYYLQFVAACLFPT